MITERLWWDIETFDTQLREKEFHMDDAIKIIQIGFMYERHRKINDPVLLKEYEEGEKRILEQFWEKLCQLYKWDSLTIGYNQYGYDIPMLKQKLVFHKLATREEVDLRFADLKLADLITWVYVLRGGRWGGSLGACCKHLGIRYYHLDFRNIWKSYQSGNYETIQQYQIHELQSLWALYWELDRLINQISLLEL